MAFRGKKTIVPPKAVAQAGSATQGSDCATCEHPAHEHLGHQTACEANNCQCKAYISPTSDQGVAIAQQRQYIAAKQRAGQSTTPRTDCLCGHKATSHMGLGGCAGCACAQYRQAGKTPAQPSQPSTTTCTCKHHEADHYVNGRRSCNIVRCMCASFDSVFYADLYDMCDCRHERAAHASTRNGAGLGVCAAVACSCSGFILHGKVASPGPQSTQSPTPAYPAPGFTPGPHNIAHSGLGSGKPIAGGVKVRQHASSGLYTPTKGINIYQDPSRHWDVVIEFEIAYGATPTNHHMVELRLNIEREHAEVLLDGHEILDPVVVEAQITAIRERILAEGSWAGAAPGDIDP